MDKLDLVVIVNGKATTVRAQPNAPLRTIIPKALEQTGNAGQPPENWEIRNAAGVELELAQKIRDHQFPADVRLFLNLKAGVGGETGQSAALEVGQFVEPAVSQAKFEEEVAEYRELEHDYRQRGWFLLDAQFPCARVLMATPTIKPPAIVFAVKLDYTNYDAVPPSVQLVDPFTDRPYLANELPTTLNRALPAQTVALPGIPQGNLQMMGAQPLMQSHTPEDVPFLCLAGVREYHEHPGHSGDAWELHRASGAGRLVRLLEVIHRYGVEPIRAYGVNLVPQVGFDWGEPPE